MSESVLDVNKIIVTRQNSGASSAAAPSSLDYGELAVDINGVLRTGNKNKQVVTHVVSTDSRLTDTRNPRVTTLTNQNLNDITTPGFYYAGGGNTVTNKPSGIAAFGLLVEQTANGYRSQLLIGGDNSPNKMFIRQYTGTSWGAWSSFYTTTYKPTPAEIGAATASHTHSYLPLSGGTMTGAITLPGNPTANLHAATKQYVDSKIASSGSGDMLKSVYDTDEDGIVDSSEKVESDGKKTSTTNSTTVDSAANEIPKTGISMYEFYNTTNSPITYANVINVRGRQAGGAGQLALGWEGSSTTPNIFYRAHRDQGNVAWGPWEKIVYESDLPSIKKTITVNGDSDKYYPVTISNYTNIKKLINPAFFGIFRNYSQKGPDDWYSATHKGSLQFISKIFVNGWSGENSFMEWELAEKYAITFGGIQHSTRGYNFVVWLRGGGADYDLMGENPALGVNIYYETTDLTESYGFSVSPKTYDQIASDYPKFDKGGSAHWKYDGTGVQKNTLVNVDLTGIPKAVTPSTSDNSTRIATTAYVNSFHKEKKSLFLDKDTYDTNNNGIVDKAETLATARTINGTSFNGSANITTTNWGTARNITIGDTKKSVNGSADITWSLGEIGAAAVDPNSGFSGAARAATQLTTARTLTIGKTGRAFNGTANLNWTLADLGILDFVYPVGSIFEWATVSGVSSPNFSTIDAVEAHFGGRWEEYGTGRVLVGRAKGITEFDTVNKEGGEQTHKLTTSELPRFRPTPSGGGNWLCIGGVVAEITQGIAQPGSAWVGTNIGAVGGNMIGGDQPHNNLQPYITVYRYRRIA